MRLITLDAKNWTTKLDFYDALLAALGAPEWHGRSVDALIDSMVWGGINAVDPPYTIRVLDTGGLPRAVQKEIETARDAIAIARDDFRVRKGYDVEAFLEIGR